MCRAPMVTIQPPLLPPPDPPVRPVSVAPPTTKKESIAAYSDTEEMRKKRADAKYVAEAFCAVTTWVPPRTSLVGKNNLFQVKMALRDVNAFTVALGRRDAPSLL